MKSNQNVFVQHSSMKILVNSTFSAQPDTLLPSCAFLFYSQLMHISLSSADRWYLNNRATFHHLAGIVLYHRQSDHVHILHALFTKRDNALIDMALLQTELQVLVFLNVHIHAYTVNCPQPQKCSGHPIGTLVISVTAVTVRPAE